jgi:hypothetical protein
MGAEGGVDNTPEQQQSGPLQLRLGLKYLLRIVLGGT